MRRAVVIVASTRGAAGVTEDRTGPAIEDWLRERGWSTERLVVADGDPVGAALREAIDRAVALILTTGGTGVSPMDTTPEQTLPLLSRILPGVAEAVRARGAAATPTAVLGRGVVGIAGGSLVANLPGSPAGVADTLAVLDGVLEHLVDQLAGGDHAAGSDPSGDSAGPHPSSRPERRKVPLDSTTPPTTASRRVLRAEVIDTPISVATLLADSCPPSAGAVVTFDGVVRDHDEGRSVTALRYSAHPSAGEVIRAVALDIAEEYPEVTLAVAHRTGDLEIGDCALACVVSSAHRREAFAACSDLVDRVKERVPIWKEQVFVGGESEWVNAIG